MQGPHALVGIPALAAVFAWQRRLTRSGQGKGEDEVASALLGLLERVEAQLTGAVDAANESSLAGMRRCEGCVFWEVVPALHACCTDTTIIFVCAWAKREHNRLVRG